MASAEVATAASRARRLSGRSASALVSGAVRSVLVPSQQWGVGRLIGRRGNLRATTRPTRLAGARVLRAVVLELFLAVRRLRVARRCLRCRRCRRRSPGASAAPPVSVGAAVACGVWPACRRPRASSVAVGVGRLRSAWRSAWRWRRRSSACAVARDLQVDRAAGHVVDDNRRPAAAGEDEQDDWYGKPRAGEAHAPSSQRGSAAIRRPHVGQSLRSFWAGWSHQLQKRSVSTAHGSRDFDGCSGSTFPTTSSSSPVSWSAIDLAGLRWEQQLAAGGRGAQAIQLALGHSREP